MWAVGGILQKEVSGCDCQEADYALTTLFFVAVYGSEANSYNEEEKKDSDYETSGTRTMTLPPSSS